MLYVKLFAVLTRIDLGDSAVEAASCVEPLR